MLLTNFGVNIVFEIMGYLIGSISFAIIISKIFGKKDIRQLGSGNAGATNALRNFGPKLGLSVFVLDICKPIIAVLIAYFIKQNAPDPWSGVSLPAVGLGAVIGHIWPAYFKFKGGKGSACFLGFFIAMQWILAVIGSVLVVAIVLKTKKVSLGSLVVPLILIVLQIIFGATGILQDTWSVPMMRDYWWINTIILIVIWSLTALKHKENIKRLLNGTERSIGQKK